MLHVSTDINQLINQAATDPDFPDAPLNETVINLRDLHDALDEHFHAKGGLKYLYTIFPGGPITQSCRLAGLKAPFIASDPSFGSVA
jgi:tRNA 2-thiouridine synthesizing protein E